MADEWDIFPDISDVFVHPETGEININIRPTPDRARVGAGEHGLPYMPPLQPQEVQEGGPEMRSYQPTLEERARVGLTDIGVPSEQAGRLAAPVGVASGAFEAIRPPTPAEMRAEFDRRRQDTLGGNLQEFAGQAVPAAALAVAPGAARVMGPPAQRLVTGAAQAIRETPALAGGLIAGGAAMTGAGEAGDDPAAQVEHLLGELDSRHEQLSKQKVDTLLRRDTSEAHRAEVAGISSTSPKGDIIRVQEKLNALGYEAGKADGNIGKDTRLALAKFQADKREEIKAANQELTGLETGFKDLDIARNRASGDQRLSQAEKNLTPWQDFVRKYGTAAGIGVGLVLGATGRYAVVKTSDALARRAAQRAEGLFEPPKPRDWPGRESKVNQFWAEGQPSPLWMQGGRKAPFEAAPGQEPPFRASATPAPAAADLYQPNRAANAAVDAGVIGAGVGEYIAVDRLVGERARAELAAAREAMQKDPSKVNVDRYQAARDVVGYVDFFSNLGRGSALGYAGTAAKVRRDKQIRPDTSEAEAERGRIDAYLARNRAPEPTTPLPAPRSSKSTKAGSSKEEGPSTRSTSKTQRGKEAPEDSPSSEDTPKLGKGGKTWHDQTEGNRGRFTAPPKKTSFLDPFRFWGGYYG